MDIHGHIPTIRVAVAGAAIREIICQRCSCSFRYRMVRRAEAWSVASFSNEQSVRQKAQRKLAEMLRSDQDPVACPSCTTLQADMVRQSMQVRATRLHGVHSAACLAVLIGLLLLLAAAAKATNFFSKRFTLGDDESLTSPGWSSLAIGAGLFAVYYALWRRSKQKLVASGGGPTMPKARREGEQLPNPPRALLEHAAPLDRDWLPVQLLDIQFPQQCVLCLKPASDTAAIEFRTRPVTVRFPMCVDCQRIARRERIRWTVILALLMGSLFGVLALFANGTLLLLAVGFGVGVFAGGVFGWDGIAYYLRPIQFREFSPLRNTAAVRFRNRSYTQAFVQANE
jgi:hypothetical protein